MNNPYLSQPRESFWSNAVASSVSVVPDKIYRKKWSISKTEKIATAGSCFAQHIGKRLLANGFAVMDYEVAPVGMRSSDQTKFGYSMYSARYGNIYTARQLLQLAKESLGLLPIKDIAWKTAKGTYIDALRPGVEPGGLDTISEVIAHREYHLSRVKDMFMNMDVFVFTLGLTEAWIANDSDIVYPTAPGTIAGDFNSDKFSFKNFTYNEVVCDLQEFIDLITLHRNGKIFKMLLTVSPVPLTATASNMHVLPATIYSKSVLRAVAGDFSKNINIDYFPSYEIVSNVWSDYNFYEKNMRSVKNEGVDFVMKTFLDCHSNADTLDDSCTIQDPADMKFDQNVVCEDAILDAFKDAK